MTSVIISNVLPEIINPVSVSYTEFVQNAYSLRFYYKGGSNVVCIQRSSKDVFTVYIPTFSSVERDKTVVTIISMENDIEREELSLGIPMGKYFLFDVAVKKILSLDSFIDFIPFGNTKHSLFVIQNEDGSLGTSILYLADQTDYGIIQFLPLVLAKRELIPSTKPAGWGKTGKKLLTYLVSKRYTKSCNFLSENGCWDNVTYKFNPKLDHHSTVNLDKHILDRSAELAASINYTTYIGYLDGTLVKEGGEQVILLSEVLHSGVKSFCNSKHNSVINVEIDILKETYKLIDIYTRSGIVFVELNQGIELTTERIKEDLDANEVNIVTGIEDLDEERYFG